MIYKANMLTDLPQKSFIYNLSFFTTFHQPTIYCVFYSLTHNNF